MEWLFLVQLATVGLMILFLQKQMQIKKQLDEITKEVSNYISYVTEDMMEETQELSTKESVERHRQKKVDKEEVQNSLIQAVLGEYFP